MMKTAFLISYVIILIKIQGCSLKSIGGGGFFHRNSATEERIESKSTGTSHFISRNREDKEEQSDGGGANDLQVSVAALTVYWMIHLIMA